MEDASDSSRGVAPLINNVALPGSSPSLPVSVTGCKSHPVANKKVEARSEKLLPTALPPSEPKVAQKLPRSAERRGSAGGTGSPAPSRAVAVQAAAAAGRDSGAGRVALAALLVGRCGGGPALAGEGLAGRGPGAPGTKRGGARDPWPPSPEMRRVGGTSSTLRVPVLRRRRRRRPGAALGEGAVAPPAAGRPPHCEAPAGRAGAAAARLTTLGTPVAVAAAAAAGRTGRVSSHKRRLGRSGAPHLTGFPFPPIC